MYCFLSLFSLIKNRMNNVVWGCAEIFTNYLFGVEITSQRSWYLTETQLTHLSFRLRNLLLSHHRFNVFLFVRANQEVTTWSRHRNNDYLYFLIGPEIMNSIISWLVWDLRAQSLGTSIQGKIKWRLTAAREISVVYILAWKGLSVVIWFSRKKITVCNGSTPFLTTRKHWNDGKKAASFEV